MTPLETVREALATRGSHIESVSPDRFMAQCPSHEDGRPSLSVRQGDRGVLLYCFAGCRREDVAADLGLRMSDLFDAHRVDYLYKDREGRTVRTVTRTPDKDFPQKGKTKWEDGTAPLYRLPEVLEAVAAGRPVYFVEGEKDAESLTLSGVTATTTAGGASSPHKSDFSPLTGAEVRIVPDRDEEGTRYAQKVRGLLEGIAASVTVWTVRTGKDFSDHYAAGYGVQDLEEGHLEDSPEETTGASQDREEDTRRVVLTPASQVRPKVVHWLWEGRLPKGTLTVLAGREGLGKSTLTVWLAAEVTRGRLDGQSHGTPGTVLWITAEDDPAYNVVPRLMAAGADLERVQFVTLRDLSGGEGPPVFPQDLGRVEVAVRESGAVLLVVDPLVSVLASNIDTHRDHSLRQALDPLSKLARDLDVTVLGLAHVGKSRVGDFADRVLGSRGLTAVTRSLLGLVVDPDDPDERRLCLGLSKSNYADKSRVPTLLLEVQSAYVQVGEETASVGRVVMLGTSDKSVSDILADSEEDREDASDAEQWLRAYLEGQGGEAPASDIKRECARDGHSWEVVRKRRKRLGVKSEKSGMRGGWMWVLPEAQTSETTPANGEGTEDREQETALESQCQVLDCDSFAVGVVPLDGKRRSLCLEHMTHPALPLLLGGQTSMDETA